MVEAPLRVLVIEDDPLFVRTLQVQLGEGSKFLAPFALTFCPHVGLGLQELRRQSFDLLLLDLHLGEHEHGLSALPKLRAAAPQLPVVVHSVATDHESIVEAMRRGAFDYLPKHVGLKTLAEQLRALVARARQERRQESAAPWGMVGESPPLAALLRQVAVAKRSGGNVLIGGESGVGKELVARALRRNDEPFVAVDAATIDNALANSVLFGHERGAFTGADKLSLGLFERAHGGILYLDEVANMPLEVQAKLLRVLQEREVCRVGGRTSRALQFRLVCASNADLPALCREGRFRTDLLTRMRVFDIHVPPLRSRRADVLPLFAHFLRRHGAIAAPGWDPAVQRALLAYPFFGNVRELGHAAEVARAHAGEGVTLSVEHLPAAIAAWADKQVPDAASHHAGPDEVAVAAGPAGHVGLSAPRGESLAQAADGADFGLGGVEVQVPALQKAAAGGQDFYAQVRAFERRTLIRAFAEHHGNISAMARTLGMDRSSLYAKLRLYAIFVPRSG